MKCTDKGCKLVLQLISLGNRIKVIIINSTIYLEFTIFQGP